MTDRRRSATPGPLRVGLLLPSLDVPAWVWAAIRDVNACSDAEVVAVAIPAGADGRKAGTAAGGVGKRAFRGALRRVDELVERRIPVDEDAYLTKDARPLVEGVP